MVDEQKWCFLYAFLQMKSENFPSVLNTFLNSGAHVRWQPHCGSHYHKTPNNVQGGSTFILVQNSYCGFLPLSLAICQRLICAPIPETVKDVTYFVTDKITI